MAISFRIYGTLEAIPTLDEVADYLEESDFEVTIECEEEDEDDWEEIFVYEESLAEPARVFRTDDGDSIEEELEEVLKIIDRSNPSQEVKDLLHTLSNCVVVYGVELPDEAEEDENALILTSLVAQCLAQKVDGVYTVDAEGIFNDAGDLIYEMAVED